MENKTIKQIWASFVLFVALIQNYKPKTKTSIRQYLKANMTSFFGYKKNKNVYDEKESHIR